MDLASSAGQLWSIHASFQKEDQSEAVRQQRQQEEIDQLQHVVDDLNNSLQAGTVSRENSLLYKINESYDEGSTDGEHTAADDLLDDDDDDDDSHGNSDGVTDNYKTNISSNPYQSGPFLNDDRSYASLEADTDVEEDELSDTHGAHDDDSDDEDDDSVGPANQRHSLLGVTSRPPVKPRRQSQSPQDDDETDQAQAQQPSNNNRFEQIPLDGMEDNASLCSLESDMSDDDDDDFVSHHHHNDASAADTATASSKQQKPNQEKCFDRVHLVSPSLFDDSEDDVDDAPEENSSQNNDKATGTDTAAFPEVRRSSQQHVQQQQHLSLSSLITPMDPKLFVNDDLSSPSERLNNKSADLAMGLGAGSSSNGSGTGSGSAENRRPGSGGGGSVYSHTSTYHVMNHHHADPHHHSPNAIMDLDQYSEMLTNELAKSSNHHHHSTSNSRRSSKLSSSFKSNAHQNRVVYSLAGGKKGMSPQERLHSKSYLPLQPATALTLKKNGLLPGKEEEETLTATATSKTNQQRRSSYSRDHEDDDGLSILLVELHNKVFEIVTVEHVYKETTVGEVLSKARTLATDPLLSQQTYTSLCHSDGAELAALMLPVHLMVEETKKNLHNNNNNKKITFQAAVPDQQHLIQPEHGTTTPTTTPSSSERLLRHYDKREQKSAGGGAAAAGSASNSKSSSSANAGMGRLLVAVPEGASADQVRNIQKALWNHPRVQRWWKKRNKKKKKKLNNKTKTAAAGSSILKKTTMTMTNPPLPEQRQEEEERIITRAAATATAAFTSRSIEI